MDLMTPAQYVEVLIPGQNITQPKFTEWVQGSITPETDLQQYFSDLPEAFNVDTAEGDQLDVLGELLGVSRIVNFQPGGGASASLTDAFYKIALKAKIVLNQWKGTKEEIYDLMATILPQYPVLITDNQDMTMDVLVIGMPNDVAGLLTFCYGATGGTLPNGTIAAGYGSGYWDGFTSILRGLVVNNYFVPKPAGVLVNYSFADGPFFSYGTTSTYFQGYGVGEWVSFV